MRDLPPFLNWLVLASLADWLITRTLTRMAIYMPKSPPVIDAYKVLGVAGQLAATLASLLVLLTLGWMAWRGFRRSRAPVFPMACLSSVLLNFFFLFIPPAGWLAAGYHLILMALILMIGLQAWRTSSSTGGKIAIELIALALLVRELYLIIPAIYQALHLPGPPQFIQAIFTGGELLVLIGLALLWWVHGRTSSWQAWLAASVPALAFTIFRLINPAMLGILAIWSTGLTLYLPWPIYALGLWMAGLTVLVAVKKRNPAGLAVLLLLAGGFAPQFSTHAFLGIIALWLLGLREAFPADLPAQSMRGLVERYAR